MTVKPLYPHAALLLDGRQKYVVVCDLHLGLEAELAQKGISVRQSQLSTELFEELNQLCIKNKADGVVIAGDLKHQVGSITKQEWIEIPFFLNRLSAVTQVFLVPGNHDSNIRNLVPPSVSFVSSSGMTLENALILHGHSMPSEIVSDVESLVMGHIHPALPRSGNILSGQPVWIYLKIDASILFARQGTIDLIIMPSFNRYLYAASGIQPGIGTVQSASAGTGGVSKGASYFKQRKSISPITNRIKNNPESVKRCIISTLDGAIVGESGMLFEII